MFTSIIKSKNSEIWIGHCPGWVPTSEGQLIRIYNFNSFKEAIEFVDEISVVVQMTQDFPEISILNAKVTLKLKTHPVHGLTEKDCEFIERVDELPYAEVDIEQLMSTGGFVQ